MDTIYRLSFFPSLCNEAAILRKVTHCYYSLIYERSVVSCELISLALQLIIIYYHVLNGNYIVQLSLANRGTS